MTATSQSKKVPARPAPPSTAVTDWIRTWAIAAPVMLVLAWALLAYGSRVAHGSIPGFPPGLPWPPAQFVAVLLIPGVFVAIAAHSRGRARMRKYARTLQAHDVARELARVGRASDPKAARGRARAWKGMTPLDLTVSPPLLAKHFDAVRDRFADYADVPPGVVEVTATKHGTRVRVVTAAMYDPQEGAQARRDESGPEPTPDPKREALHDWNVDQAKVDQLKDAFGGVLKVTKGLVLEVYAAHATRQPSRFAMSYPPGLDQAVGDRMGDLAEVLNRKCPPVDGLWKMDWQPADDRVVFEDVHDPLRKIVPLPQVGEAVDPEAGVPIGVTEDGDTFLLKLMGGSHVLIAGATGSGKGSFVWGIIRALAPLARDGLVRLWVADPKGGLELGDLEDVVHRYADTNAKILKMIQDAADSIGPKSRRVRAATGSRKITKLTRELPLDVVIVDEVAAFTGDKEYGQAASFIMQQGRAAAVTYVAATQDPRQSVLANRHLFTTAVALRVNEARDVDMILGQGMRAAGALCDRIPVKDMQGTAYIARDGVAGVIRVRAAYVDDAETQRVVQTLKAGWDLPAPEHSPAPAGAATQEPLPDPTPDGPDPVEFVPDAPTGDEWVDGADLRESVKAAKARRDGSTVYVQFDGDPDPVRVLAVTQSREYDGSWEVTYCYADERETVCELRPDDQVQVLDLTHEQFEAAGSVGS